MVHSPARATEGLQLKEGFIRRLKVLLARARANLEELPLLVTDEATTKNIAGLYQSVDDQAKKLFKNDPVKQAYWCDQVRNAEAAARNGGRQFSNRFCDESIVFALALSAKIGKRVYEDLRQWISLPSLRSLDKKRPPTPRDGVQEHTLRMMRSIGKKRGMHTVQTGALAFDSCKIKSGLVWSAHDGHLIGLATDAFDPDLIVSQYKV